MGCDGHHTDTSRYGTRPPSGFSYVELASRLEYLGNLLLNQENGPWQCAEEPFSDAHYSMSTPLATFDTLPAAERQRLGRRLLDQASKIRADAAKSWFPSTGRS